MSIRDAMLLNAVNAVRAENGALDVATVAAKLPPDFDLRDDEEFAAAVAATNPASEQYDAEQAAPLEAPADAEPLPVVEAQPMPVHELPTLQDAEENVVKLRVTLRRLSDELRIKRGKLAGAITRWQTNGAPITQGELVRDFLKSEQAERVRKAQQGYGEQASAPTPAKSHLDRLAAGSRGGSPDRGYGSSFRRGGRPVSQYGMKVPSER